MARPGAAIRTAPLGALPPRVSRVAENDAKPASTKVRATCRNGSACCLTSESDYTRLARRVGKGALLRAVPTRSRVVPRRFLPTLRNFALHRVRDTKLRSPPRRRGPMTPVRMKSHRRCPPPPLRMIVSRPNRAAKPVIPGLFRPGPIDLRGGGPIHSPHFPAGGEFPQSAWRFGASIHEAQTLPLTALVSLRVHDRDALRAAVLCGVQGRHRAVKAHGALSFCAGAPALVSGPGSERGMKAECRRSIS